MSRAENASIASLVLGGVLAATGAALLVWPSGADDERGAVRCTPGPGEAGLACRWRF